MPFDSKLINQVAHLARLNVDPQQKEGQGLLQDLIHIIGMIEKINTLNTDNIEPMSHPLDAKLKARPDKITEINQRDQLLSLSPSAEAGLYLVPQVIEAVDG